MIQFAHPQTPHLLIHYDVTNEDVRQAIRNYRGVQMPSKSVAFLSGSTSEAERFWATVASQTAGLWMKDDRLYVHFVGNEWNGMVWYETFTKDSSSLHGDPTAAYNAYMDGELKKLFSR